MLIAKFYVNWRLNSQNKCSLVITKAKNSFQPMQCTQCKVLAYFFDVTGGDKAIKHTIKYTKKCNRHR